MGNKGSRRSVNKDQRDSVYTGADDRIPCSQKVSQTRPVLLLLLRHCRIFL